MFLTVLGAGVIGTSALAGCRTEGGNGAGQPTTPGAVADDGLPNYVPIDYVEPDFASVNGSTAGFERLPEELVSAFSEPPGSGSTFTAMTPLWGAIPPTEGNQYFDAVNAAIGSTVQFQISDGNTYGDKLAAVLASERDVPDWVCIPTWNIPPRFGEAVETLFEDLTPFLAGDAVTKYPNLANISTDAWRFCVFNGKLKGLPQTGEVLSDMIAYRADIFEDEGVSPAITSGEELLDLARDLTGGGRWAVNDMWVPATIVHAVPPKWKLLDAGTLQHRYESEEYRAALEWNTTFFKEELVHPDAVADNSGSAKERFESGSVLIMHDGVGGWGEALARQRASNPTYRQSPFAPFAADGGEPVLFKASPASIMSFIKANVDKAKIEEMLAVADFLASPFGTTEYMLVNSGQEGTHYDLDADGLPVPTPLAATEVQPTYVFLDRGPVVNAQVQYPGFVEEYCGWMASCGPYLADPLFYGQQISEPNKFGTLSQPFDDLEKDVSRGRRPLTDLDGALETWRADGGDELRAFYQEILDNQ